MLPVKIFRRGFNLGFGGIGPLELKYFRALHFIGAVFPRFATRERRRIYRKAKTHTKYLFACQFMKRSLLMDKYKNISAPWSSGPLIEFPFPTQPRDASPDEFNGA